MTPTKAKRQTTSAYPDLLTLSTIEVDYQQSNPWAEVYTARSDRHKTTLYRVTYYPRESRWSCDCPGGHAPSCKHRVRAAVLREARFFERLLADATPGELRAMVPGKQSQIDTETDALSAHAALIVIDCLLAAADEPVALVAAA
jgi:hypothetical protein